MATRKRRAQRRHPPRRRRAKKTPARKAASPRAALAKPLSGEDIMKIIELGKGRTASS